MSLPIVYHPDHVTPLPEGHRFPMAKFGKVYERLVRDGIATLDQFHLPQPAALDHIMLAHDATYVRAYCQGDLDARAMRRIGFPWSEQLVKRTLTALGSTLLTAELALQHGMACSTAGGTHHAFYDFGSGYCIFNDLAIAARWLRRRGLVRRVLIVDLDVHQGDGTASILQGDDGLVTFSMHCAANFPFHKQSSDFDVALPAGVEDAVYLATLAKWLPDLLTHVRPDLVLYDAGVDPHRDDVLGKLALSDAGLLRRDQFVLTSCVQHATPVATVIGGGYSKDLDALARRHTLIHRAASEVWITMAA
ncbi:histone deacetylase [Caldilinea sp.]|uniref:histone deacetylase family protein n=1 Tax=Caldilinea sp. TaxID=2293560 RepID=UPI002C2CAD76|nr:histone deacetylase [Anaerolineales bacterium]HQY94813.1 histone deacetylase [Caldilinea sp.]